MESQLVLHRATEGILKYPLLPPTSYLTQIKSPQTSNIRKKKYYLAASPVSITFLDSDTVICVAKRQFSAYFGNFLSPFEPYLGHSGSGQTGQPGFPQYRSKVFPTLFH